MLHTKPEDLTIESVVKWLEKQPSNRAYDYRNAYGCLAQQYNKSIGREYPVLQLAKQLRADGLPLIMGEVEYRLSPFDKKLENIAKQQPRTFGAALERAKQMELELT
jgi:hypothetical protein